LRCWESGLRNETERERESSWICRHLAEVHLYILRCVAGGQVLCTCSKCYKNMLQESGGRVLRRRRSAVDMSGVRDVVSVVHVLKHGCFAIQLAHTYMNHLRMASAAQISLWGELLQQMEPKFNSKEGSTECDAAIHKDYTSRSSNLLPPLPLLPSRNLSPKLLRLFLPLLASNERPSSLSSSGAESFATTLRVKGKFSSRALLREAMLPKENISRSPGHGAAINSKKTWKINDERRQRRLGLSCKTLGMEMMEG
jgi:hypothetical protein